MLKDETKVAGGVARAILCDGGRVVRALLANKR